MIEVMVTPFLPVGAVVLAVTAAAVVMLSKYWDSKDVPPFLFTPGISWVLGSEFREQGDRAGS